MGTAQGDHPAVILGGGRSSLSRTDLEVPSALCTYLLCCWIRDSIRLSCAISDKVLNLSVPQFSMYKMWKRTNIPGVQTKKTPAVHVLE